MAKETEEINSLEAFRRAYFPERTQEESSVPQVDYKPWPRGDEVARELIEEVARATAALTRKR